MGSSFFYAEFLIAWIHLLHLSGRFKNPALFALEYTLVPEAIYPTQLHETLAGYEWLLTRLPPHLDSSRVCVAGDSAGATLILSLLLTLAEDVERRSKMPGFSTLISPWCVLVSPKNRDTPSDYLNAESLHLYGRQYVGERHALSKAKIPRQDLKPQRVTTQDSRASPGCCSDLALWREASPRFGWHFVYGTEEVFAPETKGLIERIRFAEGVQHSKGMKVKPALGHVRVTEEEAGIHAWPVVSLFLASSRKERTRGLQTIVDIMGEAMLLGEGMI